MFENKREPLATVSVFFRRIAYNATLALLMVILGLAIGMIGYHYFEPEMPLIDVFHCIAFVLADQGTLIPMQSNGGKVFMSIYALFSGLFFASIIGILFAPIVHRFMHSFHMKEKKHSKETS